MKEHKYIYSIGQWVVKPGLLMLEYEGKDYRVQDKVMRVLVVLLEANGEVVQKEVFYQKVWTNTVVTESSLSKAISELRKIFANSRNSNIIETIPTKGYRINTVISKERKFKSELQVKKKYRLLIAFSFVVLVLLSWITIKVFKNESKIAATLDPTGNLVAYYEIKEGRYSLFIENLEEKVIKEVGENLDPETFAIHWSPDRESLVYNASKKKDPFYSINVVDLTANRTVYIKFAKNSSDHETNSIPKNFNSPTLFVEHKEIKRGKNKIHHIYLNQKDTIKVFFQNNRILNFSW